MLFARDTPTLRFFVDSAIGAFEGVSASGVPCRFLLVMLRPRLCGLSARYVAFLPGPAVAVLVDRAL